MKVFDKQVKHTGKDLYPSIPFCISLIASKGSGKTTRILNFLLEDFKGDFSNCYFFSPTFQSDDKLEQLKKQNFLKPDKKVIKNNVFIEEDKQQLVLKDSCIFSDPFKMEENLKKILQDIKENTTRKERDSKPSIFIFDDLLGSKFIACKEMVKFIANSRHFGASIIFSIQSYKGIPKSIRLNFDSVYIYPTGNVKELALIYEENVCNFSSKEFLAICKEVFIEYSYTPVVINNRNVFNYKLCLGNDSFIR